MIVHVDLLLLKLMKKSYQPQQGKNPPHPSFFAELILFFAANSTAYKSEVFNNLSK